MGEVDQAALSQHFDERLDAALDRECGRRSFENNWSVCNVSAKIIILFSTAINHEACRPLLSNGLRIQTETFANQLRGFSDGQKDKIKATFMDVLGCSIIEDARQKEDASSNDRSQPKENSGCDPTKGIRDGAFTRLAGMRGAQKTGRSWANSRRTLPPAKSDEMVC